MRLAREARASVDAIPSRYAGGLMALARDAYEKGDSGIYDRILEGVERVARAMERDASLRRLLESPLIPADRQLAAVLAVLDSPSTGLSVPREVRNFIGVVVRNRRAALLSRIIAAFRALDAERRGEEQAEIVSAVALDDTQRAQIVAALNRAGHARVRLVERVDPSILGGLVVKIGSRLYDSSIRSRLQRLSYAMKGAA
ncbi:MAG: ATP synthase F1 subunit delta [Acetobacteraceae bacterium]